MAPQRYGFNLKCVTYKLSLWVIFSTYWEFALGQMPQDLTDENSTWVKARYGGSNMKKINNGGRLLIFYMMEGIKKVN